MNNWIFVAFLFVALQVGLSRTALPSNIRIGKGNVNIVWDLSIVLRTVVCFARYFSKICFIMLMKELTF